MAFCLWQYFCEFSKTKKLKSIPAAVSKGAADTGKGEQEWAANRKKKEGWRGFTENTNLLWLLPHYLGFKYHSTQGKSGKAWGGREGERDNWSTD